jgi:hypothetical protein
MVAINSIPQHEVANGKGHTEFALANPIPMLATENDVQGGDAQITSGTNGTLLRSKLSILTA